jgi:ATP-dependent helicase/nuclease subunit B
LRAARWFLSYDAERRTRIARSIVEIKGALAIPLRETFTLKGRADRIDVFPDGSAAILDYKTGSVPTDKQMQKFLSPQLPLEAAMLIKGAFGDVSVPSVKELVHVRLTGGEPAGEEMIAKVDANRMARESLARLTRHIARYDDETQPYRSREMPFRKTDAGDYDHLARVREWSLAVDDWE